ncbi:MAG: tetratricopeptide repeat protein [Deltaproteobacteria bacterium]
MPSQSSQTPQEQFILGKGFLEEDNIDRALRAFEKAYKADKENAEYISYYGLCKALRGGEIGYGLELCTLAIKKEFSRAEFYLNLGRVYLATGNKKGAIKVFKKGIKFEPGNAKLRQELADLGFRDKPVIEGIDRDNPLNKYLGILIRRTLPGIFNKKKKALKGKAPNAAPTPAASVPPKTSKKRK